MESDRVVETYPLDADKFSEIIKTIEGTPELKLYVALVGDGVEIIHKINENQNMRIGRLVSGLQLKDKAPIKLYLQMYMCENSEMTDVERGLVDAVRKYVC